MRFPLLFVLVFAVAGCDGEPASRAIPSAPEYVVPARKPVLILSVPDKAAEGSARYEADWSFDIRDEQRFSVHVHVIPPGQMVPLHQHPRNWELSFVAAGSAEWAGVAVVDGETTRFGGELAVGEGFVAPAGAMHEVRNRGAETLAVVVVHQPRFGQNWYVPEGEVVSNVRVVPIGESDIAAPEGWSVGWVDGEGTASGDRILLVAGSGTVSFEDKVVPITPGTVASFPPGLAHTLAGEGLKVLAVEVPL